MRDFLSINAKRQFETIINILDTLGVKFSIDDRLVRGLDYYQRTTFEFVSTALKSANTAIGGGGRYDELVETLGGPRTPGVGFALGLDRTLLACNAEGVFCAPSVAVDVFVVDTTGGMNAAQICQELRDAGIRTDRAYDNRSMKAQMKAAGRSGANLVVIIGEQEVDKGTVILRQMNTGQQQEIDRTELTFEVQK
jgi:histidyl-tRNA synthetase